MTILSQEFVFAALQSTEEFPIDFDDVWQPLGYSTKQKAMNRLIATHEENADYQLNHKVKLVKLPQGGSFKKDSVLLTVDAFKSFCMVAETVQGREVRKYFIDIEKAYRTNLEHQFAAPVPPISPTSNDSEAVASHRASPFPRTMQDLVDATGTSKANLVRICKQYLIENTHYQKEIQGRKHLYFFSQQVFDEIVVSVRSKRGIDLSKVSSTIIIAMQDYTSHTGKKVINQTLPSPYEQLNLF